MLLILILLSFTWNAAIFCHVDEDKDVDLVLQMKTPSIDLLLILEGHHLDNSIK